MILTISEYDLDTWVRTVIGEARGESYPGRVAVAWVIANRALRPGWWTRQVKDVKSDTIAAACLKPFQFTCWNEHDPNLRYIATIARTHQDYVACAAAVLPVLAGQIEDPTKGSCNYYRIGSEKPGWALGHAPVVTIDHHEFYNSVS